MREPLLRRARVLLALLAVGCGEAPVDTSWHDEAGYRWRPLEVTRRGRDGFTPMRAARTGIVHANVVDDEHALANRHLLIGAGAALADVDQDGRVDVFLASVEAPAALYRNDGDTRFVDETAQRGIDLAGAATTGATFADIDGDGDPDLLVGTLGGPVFLFRNDGSGRFSNDTQQSGLTGGLAATTLALADVDGDGDLDLYVATYKVRNALDAYPPQARAFDQVVKKVGDRYQVLPEWAPEYRIEDRPDLGGIVRSQRADRDLFFLNDGTGHFTAEPTAGARWRDERGVPLADAPDFFGLAARFYDVNGDGAPDLYVCNDFEDPDQFWLNDGRGGFQLIPALALRATSNTCMSVDFGDVNRDGAVDVFTADMLSPGREARQRQIPTHTPLRKTVGESPDRAQWMRNMLHLARGDGTWAQVADFAGVAATDWTWGSAFVDVDLDGYEDLLTAAGHRWDVRDADTFDRIRNAFPRVAWNREQGEFPRLAVPSQAFRNNGDATFSPRPEWQYGADSAVAHALALGDLDGDGDLDVVVTRLGEPPVLYRNESTAPRVAVRLAGRPPNSHGIGAVVTVRAASLPTQSREVTAGGMYLSGSDPLLAFATGRDSAVRVEVRWRSGRRTVIDGVRANTLLEVREGDDPPPPSAAVVVDSASSALFADATPLLGGHRHRDAIFDDFARQPLLPHRFSQTGPGIAWVDADGDGRDDLVVGDGRGGALTVLRNTARGFVRSNGGPVAGDLGAIVPLVSAEGVRVLVSQSNYEATGDSARLLPSVLAFGLTAGRPSSAATAVGGDSATVGALALGDVDGDGVLDLFVGARVVPGAWPLPARSHLYRGRADGSFVLDPANDAALSALGLVTAATCADLNGDGRADLVVASEWGPIRVLLNDAGRLRDATESLGLTGRSSRWLGVTSGDFDGDGRLDLVATSWGRNVPWRASPERPHALLVGRVDDQFALVFAQVDSTTGKEMPTESLARLGVALPSVRRRIGSYTEYARSDVAAVLGEQASGMVRVGATTYDHVLLLNRGDRFEARSLPPAAQQAPASAPVVADFDGDGREDLFLAQNFYPTEIGTLRFDAGAGLVLRGDGAGGFSPLSVRAAGLSVLGDQRGAATADFDGDARADLAVAQNGEATRLFRNVGGRPGVRVRLEGGVGNATGIGAQLRVRGGGGGASGAGALGPVRELRAGTGYWSTDGATTVLAVPEGATAVQVRWPGGQLQDVPLPSEGRTLVIRRARTN